MGSSKLNGSKWSIAPFNGRFDNWAEAARRVTLRPHGQLTIECVWIASRRYDEKSSGDTNAVINGLLLPVLWFGRRGL